MRYTLQKINKAAADPLNVIKQAEQEYHSKLAHLADDLAHSHKKIIMLAGPSGSGKTTSAHLLQGYLKRQGINSLIISLDNFFLPPGRVPRLEGGGIDYESVHALDIPEMNRCFSELLKEGNSRLPIFDFMIADRSEKTLDISLGRDDIVIVEGIHALNPMLYSRLPEDRIFKFYVSVSSSIYSGDKKLLGGRKLRFIRRLCRDYIYRNSSAENTLKMWPGVMEGEGKYLYPFKSTADCCFDTFHAYEVNVFAAAAARLLRGVPGSDPQSPFVAEILSAVECIESIDESLVPADSLIKEFIAG